MQETTWVYNPVLSSGPFANSVENWPTPSQSMFADDGGRIGTKMSHNQYYRMVGGLEDENE